MGNGGQDPEKQRIKPDHTDDKMLRIAVFNGVRPEGSNADAAAGLKHMNLAADGDAADAFSNLQKFRVIMLLIPDGRILALRIEFKAVERKK